MLINAFSPNGDGSNDIFRPSVMGKMKQYELMVHNRYGQMIFTTHSPTVGWDGTIKGTPQNAGYFVWQCRYKIRNELVKYAKGIVFLMR